MSSLKRKAHILKTEKSLAIPRHLIFFDTETIQEKINDSTIRQRLRLGWSVYYSRGHGRHLETMEWTEFYNDATFWDNLFSHTGSKTKLWVIARNISFDFTVVRGWRYLKEHGYKLKFFYSSGTTTIISVHKKSSAIVFLDSMNWFVESLKKTGERIGLPKLEIDFEKCTKKELSTYCRRDVEIELENFKLFIKFLESNRIARLCYTRGSTAMSCYLLNHYATPIYIHNNEQAINLERESYKGGRTECFYIGELKNENYYTLDVNSLYPFVMSCNLYPTKYKRILQQVGKQTLAAYLKDKAVVSKVLVNTNEPAYAVKQDRTIFPVGRFWTTLCTPELKYALERNHIETIHTTVIYEQAELFRSYVEKLYALRQEFKSAGVAEYEELCKKMLNSLYGKFGQKGEEWVKIGDCPNEPDRVEQVFYPARNKRGMLRYLLGEIFEMQGFGECFDSFPAIAAHVTAYARMYLYKLMKVCGKGNYFYCDTDSLIVNERGLKCLQSHINPTKLGSLKIESRYNHLTIRGLKDYSLPSKTVIKGVRKNAVKIADGVYEQEQWATLKGVLRSGNANEYTVKTMTKHLTREYTKGTVTVDGKVCPFVLDESL